jgi:5'-nucleotidase / UDP-sugar diphosphatase
VSRAPQPFDGFFQVSGLQVHYNPAHPSGQRVTLVSTGGAAIDARHTYRVATTRSVAEGGMGYFRVWNHEAIVDSTGVTVAAGLTSYLSAHKTLTSAIENRITTR